MPNLPARCDKCKKTVISEVNIKNDTYHIRDCEAGVCDCGGKLRLFDGTYCHLGGPINFCNAPHKVMREFWDMCDETGVEVHIPCDEKQACMPWGE